jgi:septum formation protein
MIQKVILASSSPRRKELLEMAGVPFEVIVADINETPLKKELPEKMVARLSKIKAETVAELSSQQNRLLNDSVLILAADTTVVSETKKNLGKPETIEEAKKMIKTLQGKKHHVFTAYTLLQILDGKIKKSVTRTVRTDVFIKSMTTSEIDIYVAQGECMDKAGAYAAQGFGMALIEKISGSYTNVVGLPVTQVVADMKKLGWK